MATCTRQVWSRSERGALAGCLLSSTLHLQPLIYFSISGDNPPGVNGAPYWGPNGKQTSPELSSRPAVLLSPCPKLPLTATLAHPPTGHLLLWNWTWGSSRSGLGWVNLDTTSLPQERPGMPPPRTPNSPSFYKHHRVSSAPGTAVTAATQPQGAPFTL